MPPRPSSHHRRWASTSLSLCVFCAAAAQASNASGADGVAIDAGLESPAVRTLASDSADQRSRYQDRFWLSDARIDTAKPDADTMKLELHGEYLLRATAVPSVGLSTYGFSDYEGQVGQSLRLEHRLRFTPRFHYRDKVAIIAQFDAPHGSMLGEQSGHLAGDREQQSTIQPMRVAGRWLYTEIRIPNAHLRIGQQPAHWGSGLVLASGDERQFLGDPRLGTIVERVSYQGKPFGPSSWFELLLATDLVFSDHKIRLWDGDLAARALLGLSLATGAQQRLGVLFMAEELRPHYPDAALNALRPSKRTATIDVEARYAFPVPGQTSFITLAAEAAAVVGDSTGASEVLGPAYSRVEQFGALGQLGAMGTKGSGSKRWGNWGLMLEAGYTSGDANIGDGVDRRFYANPSRRVGLILFDEVLRFRHERAAAALQDPRVAMRRSASGSSLPTAGGVSGATYLILQGQYRPYPNLDLRAAALVAQASADLVDPARLYINGRWANYDAGSPSHRDLGLELDWASEFRLPLQHSMALAIGAEAGVLFPGRGLANENQTTIGVQRLIRGRVGFYF